MSNTINIREATIEDSDVLVQIAWESFYGAFANHPANSPEILKTYMDETYIIEALSGW